MAIRLLVFFLFSHIFASPAIYILATDVEPENKQVVIQLQNHQDKGHFFTIRVGDPSYNYRFTMLLDISHPSIWIPAQGCDNCFGSFLYNCSQNQQTCFQDKDKPPTELVYHSISALATKGFEMIHFKGIPVTESFNHTVYLASQISEHIHNYNIDGVFGMGLDNPSEGRVSILRSLYENGWISSQCFSLYLIHNPGGSDTKSHIVFGGYDPDYIHNSTTDFMRAPVVSENYWAVSLKGIVLENEEIPLKSTIALLSNSFSDIGMPKEDLEEILNVLKEKGIDCELIHEDVNPLCKCPKNKIDNFPHLMFQLDGFNINISRSCYVNFRAKAFHEKLDPEAVKGYNCFLRFRMINQIMNPLDKKDEYRTWVFGRTVLNDYYTLFDQDNKQIGFAPARTEGQDYQTMLNEILLYCVLGFFFVGFSLLFFIYKCVGLRRKLQSKRLLDNQEEPIVSMKSSGLYM